MNALEQAIQHERDCALSLYNAACTLMLHSHRRHDADSWHNLENAAHRWNAAMQAARNEAIRLRPEQQAALDDARAALDRASTKPNP